MNEASGIERGHGNRAILLRQGYGGQGGRASRIIGGIEWWLHAGGW
jgi:hypothetical protein